MTNPNGRVLQLVAIVLTTLAEVPSAPAGVLYSGLMARYSLAEYMMSEAAMLREGLITKAYHVLTITDAGKILAKSLTRAIMASQVPV